MRSVIFGILLSFSFVAQAQTPADALKSAVAKLTEIGNTPDMNQRVRSLCSLAGEALDVPVLGQALLGPTFSKLTRDAQGVADFTALVPSIIVTDFYNLVNGEAGKKFWVDTLVALPKGSGRVGYKVYFGSTLLVVTMSKTTMKIVDAEWNNISLVQKKADEYKTILQAEVSKDPNGLPVTALVKEILSTGNVVRCN